MPNNPYKGYGLLDWISDAPKSDVLGKIGYNLLGLPTDYGQHVAYYMGAEDYIKNNYPDIYSEVGARGVGNQMDNMLNFIGGYDWAARKEDPEYAVQAARAYQFGDTAKDPTDAIGDFNDNSAGANFYDPMTGRIKNDDLIKAAYEYSRTADRQNYDDFKAPDIAGRLRKMMKGD